MVKMVKQFDRIQEDVIINLTDRGEIIEKIH